jgi:hypothetical protein
MMARGKSERMNGKGGVFLSGSNDFFRGNSPWQPINL